jgi:dephospho-CoA kinase
VPFVLGLTGNIACGKSTIGQLLTEQYGADYVDADRVVHTLYSAGSPETLAIAARFGADLVQPDGTIDRRRLGDIVMADAAALKELQAILDPSARRAILERLANSRAPVVVLDAIRLIESGLYQRCNVVWVVVCDRSLQIERLQSTRNFTFDQALARVDAQTPIADKLSRATAVITNNRSIADLQSQVEAAWQRSVQSHLAQSSPP